MNSWWRKIIFISVVGCFFISSSQAQEEDDASFYMSSLRDIQPKHSLHIEIGMPIVLANKFNRTFMDGLVHFSPYYQFTLDNHLAIGAGAFYNYHRIKSINIYENIFGGANTIGGFVKISHEKFHGTRFGTDMGMKIGFAETMYYSNKLKLKNVRSQQLGFFVEPTMAFVLTVAEKSSFRFILGYRITGMPFSNTTIGMDTDNGMPPSAFKKVQQFLTVGFGYTFYAKTRN